eukprot:gnl/MRDRNA2_/MRDRNA2_38288_c0_seq1.p2 gnl/MRDRNA2_/MRDRNA2_38288_c0~~gnl/MRDRNA2_/MRDRNA2_38288_c0_seq1.p2  ORF type:complete len:120 (+),score=13.03 gnl/MRDRNA2_/MRDRNA2_38288_c0_seq1:339-698(+)
MEDSSLPIPCLCLNYSFVMAATLPSNFDRLLIFRLRSQTSLSADAIHINHSRLFGTLTMEFIAEANDQADAEFFLCHMDSLSYLMLDSMSNSLLNSRSGMPSSRRCNFSQNLENLSQVT